MRPRRAVPKVPTATDLVRDFAVQPPPSSDWVYRVMSSVVHGNLLAASTAEVGPDEQSHVAGTAHAQVGVDQVTTFLATKITVDTFDAAVGDFLHYVAEGAA